MSADDHDQGERLFTEPPRENIPLAYAAETPAPVSLVRFFKILGRLMMVYGIWLTISCGVGFVGRWFDYGMVPISFFAIDVVPWGLWTLFAVCLTVAGLLLATRRHSTTRWLRIVATLVIITIVFDTAANVALVIGERSQLANWWARHWSLFALTMVLEKCHPLIRAAACLLLARSRLLRGYLGVA